MPHPPVLMHPLPYYPHSRPYLPQQAPPPSHVQRLGIGPVLAVAPTTETMGTSNASSPGTPVLGQQLLAPATSTSSGKPPPPKSLIIVSKKKTMSKKNLLSANKVKATTKTKVVKAKPKTPSKISKRRNRSANIAFQKKEKRRRWEVIACGVLDKLKERGIFNGSRDEIIPEILDMAERCFLGRRMREATMEKYYVLPCIERLKRRKARQEQLDDDTDADDRGTDSPACEDSIDDDVICVGGLCDDDDGCAHGGDDEDDNNNSSLNAAATPVNHPGKEAVDATASNRYDQRIPRKNRFNSTKGADPGQTVPAAAGADSSSPVPASSSMPAPLSTHKTIKIKAKQDVHLMIVPDQKKGDKKFSTRTVEQRRDAWVKLTDGRLWNGNNKAQKARGLYYSGEAIKNNREVLKIDPKRLRGADVEIRVSDTVEGQEDHFVKIHYLSGEERVEFGEKANNFAEKWDKRAFDTSSRTCIQGGMIKCGFGKGAGHHPRFFLGGTWNDMYSDKAKAGFTKGVTTCQEALNVIGKSILQKYFPRAFESIRKTNEDQEMKVPREIGGDDGLCMNIIQSGSGLRNKGGPMKGDNFTVECHVDSKDLSKYCASIWTSSDSSDPAGWYFVLPFLTCVHNGKKYEGIAIRLRHGVGIEWAGRNLFHCSTAPDTCGIDVNGTFYGVPGATIE